MKKNIGTVDRVIRLIAAVVLVVLFFTKLVTGTWGIIILVVAALLLITNLFKFCPAYMPFGINTCKVDEKK
ncbi:MAG: DUF2892 domain-containing protein [bacterium]